MKIKVKKSSRADLSPFFQCHLKSNTNQIEARHEDAALDVAIGVCCNARKAAF